MREYKETKYTDEHIIAQSKLAEQVQNSLIPFKPEADGKFSADKFEAVGPCGIPCRETKAEDIAELFDKPENVAWFDDLTPAGKQIGTQILVHKKWFHFVKRRLELTKEVFEEAGIFIGDPKQDTFVTFEEMKKLQDEAERRHNEELAEDCLF